MRTKTALLLLFLLPGCVGMGDHLAELRTKDIKGDNFSQALAAEYLAYAEARSEEGHPIRANYFAGKGLDSLSGKPIELEKKDSLEDSRQALLEVLTPDVKDVAPAKAARAQLMFDCWAEKEGVCKEGFLDALTDLQFIADALVHGDNNRFTLPFAPKSSVLDAQGASILDIVAKRVANLGEYEVEVLPAGKKGALTTARLLAIEKGLIKRGVNAGKIHTHRKDKSKAVILSSDEKEDINSVILSIQTYGQPKEARTP